MEKCDPPLEKAELRTIWCSALRFYRSVSKQPDYVKPDEYNPCFSTYFGGAFRNRLCNIWRDYNLKNLICIGEQEDYHGNITRILVESDWAKEYREKQRQRNKAWYEKKKAEQALINPPKPKKTPMTKEERSRKVMAYQKEYYAAHPDKLAERREKNRIRERERRAARKAAIIAIARNEFYTDDTLYQKTFMDEGYKKRVNTGQLDQYLSEADHPAIIDHEMFRKANDAIREHGEAYGNDKAKGTKRYVFSGKLRCGCCGGSMSRGKNVRQGKEEKAFYACENHKHKRSVAQGTCPMLPVFEQDVKNAFATVLNRLAAEPSILDIHDDGAEREKLEAQLQSVKRRQSLLHDRALADRYTVELREKKAALDSEEKTILDALAKLEKNPVDDLQKAVRKQGVKETFETADEALFAAFVDHAVLWSKEKAQFHFTCGLMAEEDMRVRKVGRSYAPLPVWTEFDTTQKGAFTWQ